MAENFRNGRHGSSIQGVPVPLFHDDPKHLLPGSVSAHFLEEEYADAVFPFSAYRKPRVEQALEKNLCDICNKIPNSVSWLTLGVFCRLYARNFLRFLLCVFLRSHGIFHLDIHDGPIPQLSCSKEERYSPSSPMTRLPLLRVIRLPPFTFLIFGYPLSFLKEWRGIFVPRRSFLDCPYYNSIFLSQRANLILYNFYIFLTFLRLLLHFT